MTAITAKMDTTSVTGKIHSLYYESLMLRSKAQENSDLQQYADTLATNAYSALKLIGGHPNEKIVVKKNADIRFYLSNVSENLSKLLLYKDQFEEIDLIKELFEKVQETLFGSPLLLK